MDNNYKLDGLPFFWSNRTPSQNNKSVEMDIPKDQRNDSNRESVNKSLSANQQDEYIPSNQNQSPTTYSLHDIKKSKSDVTAISNVNITQPESNGDADNIIQKSNLNLTAELSVAQFDNKKNNFAMIDDLLKEIINSATKQYIVNTLENNNIELQEGDVLSIKLNKDGQFTLDANSSIIESESGEAIMSLCEKITEDLNQIKTDDGSLLGKWIISQIAGESNIDITNLNNKSGFNLTLNFQNLYESASNKSGDADDDDYIFSTKIDGFAAKSKLNKIITDLFESKNINWTKGDVLNLDIDNNGNFKLEYKDNFFEGKKSGRMCRQIADSLNKEKLENDLALGNWIIAQVADEKNIDITNINNDPNFKLSINIDYNIKINGKGVIHDTISGSTLKYIETEKETSTIQLPKTKYIEINK